MYYLEGMDDQYPIKEREYFLKICQKLTPQSGVLLSTCDRVEYYSDHKLDIQSGYSLSGIETIRHLFRLASGILSPLPGEYQILGQIKSAYRLALEKGVTGKALNLLFQRALSAARDVRNRSGISIGAVSHAQVTADIIRQRVPAIRGQRISVIGINPMTESLVKYLLKRGAQMVFLGNRSYEKARLLSERLGCFTFHLDMLKETLTQTDILITAASCPHPLVGLEHFPIGKKMLVFDLAVPGNFDETIRKADGITYWDIHCIEKESLVNRAGREGKITGAAILADQYTGRFIEYLEKREGAWKKSA